MRVGTVVALGAAGVVVAAGAAVAAGWPEGRATRLMRRGILAGAGLTGLALATRAPLDADGLWAELLGYTRGFTVELILLPSAWPRWRCGCGGRNRRRVRAG